jgi:hypothetical protein
VTIGPAVTISASVKKVWEMLIGLAIVAVLSSGEKGKIVERTSFCLPGTASCVSAALKPLPEEIVPASSR